ncbi:MAG: hypothetical protein MI725_17395 [Pirellulales bacterium]|nr:hypothetical protein [Pirellulales bacterium]
MAKVFVIALAVVFVAQLLWRRWRMAQQRARRQWAMLEFADLREPLQREFLAAAAATGKPRGLRWKQCDLHDNQLFAVDRATGLLYALVGATIGFEAVPGGGMEEVEAVGDLRSATAVFVYHQGRWTTEGRVVFNLEPEQALASYQESLQRFE